METSAAHRRRADCLELENQLRTINRHITFDFHSPSLVREQLIRGAVASARVLAHGTRRLRSDGSDARVVASLARAQRRFAELARAVQANETRVPARSDYQKYGSGMMKVTATCEQALREASS
jgi:hypothetical protein